MSSVPPAGEAERQRPQCPHDSEDVEAAREGTGLLGTGGEVPSAEEIGAEFERFLADQDRRRPRD